MQSNQSDRAGESRDLRGCLLAPLFSCVFVTLGKRESILSSGYKVPESVLVIIYALTGEVLLIERADCAGFWQSVTGSKDTPQESFRDTAVREVWEETGIDVTKQGVSLVDWHLENVYEIYPGWRWRYQPDITHNREHVFGLRLAEPESCRLNPIEHTRQLWLPFLGAADLCYSASNAEAILQIPNFDSKFKP